MRSLAIDALLLSVFAFAAESADHPQPFTAGTPKASVSTPVLLHTCLITNDVGRLVKFYREVLQIPAVMEGSEYAEFRTGVGVLAVFSADAQDRYVPGEAEAESNRSAILEFEVRDVDREYVRLRRIVRRWVKPPTDQPWGTRSIHFRDPDGNLIDFYARREAS